MGMSRAKGDDRREPAEERQPGPATRSVSARPARAGQATAGATADRADDAAGAVALGGQGPAPVAVSDGGRCRFGQGGGRAGVKPRSAGVPAELRVWTKTALGVLSRGATETSPPGGMQQESARPMVARKAPAETLWPNCTSYCPTPYLIDGAGAARLGAVGVDDGDDGGGRPAWWPRLAFSAAFAVRADSARDRRLGVRAAGRRLDGLLRRLRRRLGDGDAPAGETERQDGERDRRRLTSEGCAHDRSPLCDRANSADPRGGTDDCP